jgi:hypothetical protein
MKKYRKCSLAAQQEHWAPASMDCRAQLQGGWAVHMDDWGLPKRPPTTTGMSWRSSGASYSTWGKHEQDSVKALPLCMCIEGHRTRKGNAGAESQAGAGWALLTKTGSSLCKGCGLGRWEAPKPWGLEAALCRRSQHLPSRLPIK